MSRSLMAMAACLVSAGLADAGGTVNCRLYYTPVYCVTSVPVYYVPVVCAPVRIQTVTVIPNLAIPTPAPPSQTREPPSAPNAPASKPIRPLLLDGPRVRPAANVPPVVTGVSLPPSPAKNGE
jgi:hypothetical protein